MHDLKLAATDSTPEVTLNLKDNIFDFSGVSYAENASAFYEPIFDWLSEYGSLIQGSKPQKVTCNYKFEYLNSASYIVVRDIAEKLLDITENIDVPLELNWFYEKEDIDMYELAKEFEYLLDMKINYYHMSNN